MITQRASGTARSHDLVERLVRDRRPSRVGTALVGVVGGTRQGRTALISALQSAATASAEVVYLDEPVHDVDAVLYLTDGGTPLTGPEMELLRAASAGGRPLMLVAGAIERNPQWQDVLTSDLECLRRMGVAVEPFAVSTRLYGAAEASNDRERAIASGLPTLAARFAELSGQADAFRPESPFVETMLDRARSSAPPAPQNDKPRKPGRRPSTAGPSWQQVLGDGAAAVSSDVDFDLRTRVRTVLAEAERAVDEGDPDQNWTELDGWLRERLVHEAQLTCALLTARVQDVAAKLGTHLGGATPSAVVPPLPAREELFEHVPPRRPVTDGRPLATRGQALVRSAYGGVLMSFVLPRLAGLKIPMWVLGAGALITAIALVAATLMGERKRRLDRARTQARTIVRSCTDGFLLSASKHTRDALRSAQQQLRDECAARAEQPRPESAAVPLRPWRPPDMRSVAAGRSDVGRPRNHDNHR